MSLVANVVAVEAAGGERHVPDALVWQTVSTTASPDPPSSGTTVIKPGAPMLMAEAAKKPVPLVPGMLTMPSPEPVTPMDIRSGTGLLDAESRNVFSPTVLVAAAVLVHLKTSATSVAPNAAVGV